MDFPDDDYWAFLWAGVSDTHTHPDHWLWHFLPACIRLRLQMLLSEYLQTARHALLLQTALCLLHNNYCVSASKNGVVQNSNISAIMPTSLFEALFSISLHPALFWQLLWPGQGSLYIWNRFMGSDPNAVLRRIGFPKSPGAAVANIRICSLQNAIHIFDHTSFIHVNSGIQSSLKSTVVRIHKSSHLSHTPYTKKASTVSLFSTNNDIMKTFWSQ